MPTPTPLMPADDIIIAADAPVKSAMEILDRATARIALVTDEKGRLLGSVVDGDVRRALLRGHGLQTPVREIMHQNPTTLPQNAPRQQILETMRTLDIKQIPLVTEDGRIAGIVVHDILVGLQHAPRPNTVVIMAGGRGKRLMPITSDIPKPMVNVGGKPLLEWVVLRLAHYGFTNFTFAVNYLGHMIEDYFGNGANFGCRITYLKEKEFLGTAGALSLLPKDQQHPILVMNGDILSSIDFTELLDFHESGKYEASVCARSHRLEVPFGVIQSEGGRLTGIAEKPVYDNLISAGIYVLSPQVLHTLQPNTPLDMPNLLLSLVQANKGVGVFTMQEEWVDVGRHDDLERVKQSFSAHG